MSPEDLEQAYQQAFQGTAEPKYIVCPEGAFLRKPDGTCEVFDFDAEGNHYPLPIEEQQRRIDAMKKRLGIET